MRWLLLLTVFGLGSFVGPASVTADEEREKDARHREELGEKAGVSKKDVRKAIESGAEFLLAKYAKGFDKSSWNSTVEFVMLTLAHAGVDPSNDVFQLGLKALETCKLRYTYRVAALAMALARIDKWKYRARIAHCAQWLVDTQLKAGEWGYPRTLTPTSVPRPVEVPAPEVDEEALKSGGENATDALLTIRRTRKKLKNFALDDVGDISNTQFALLGLKSCRDARIHAPAKTWKKALGYFRKYQQKDGGWGYVYAGRQDRCAYASMTCAGICSVAVCREGLGKKEPGNHLSIKRGLKWLGKNFSTESNHNIENSGIADPLRWFYYYLYSIERVGMMLGIDEIGKKAWYPVGAKYLIENQRPDGSWSTGIPARRWRQAGDIHTADTCFAILFLTRSTPRVGVPVTTGR